MKLKMELEETNKSTTLKQLITSGRAGYGTLFRHYDGTYLLISVSKMFVPQASNSDTFWAVNMESFKLAGFSEGAEVTLVEEPVLRGKF